MDSDINEKNANDIELFKILTEHFGSRSNFYLLAQAALFSVFVATYSTLTNSYTILRIAISLLGLIIAIFWFMALRGSILWIQLWRERIIKIDKEIEGKTLVKSILHHTVPTSRYS